MTRRETKRELNPVQTQQPRSIASPQSSVAKTRKQRTPQPPSLTRETSRSQIARRSSQVAPLPTTTQRMESPSKNPKSDSKSRQVQPRSLAVSRGQQGVAGAIRERNLQNATGGMVSPATQASDSARRRQSVSTPSPQQLLTPTQTAVSRRSRSQANSPTTTLKATTTVASSLTGSKAPSDQTLQASAAASQIAARATPAAASAQAGQTEIDLGPTKIVASSTPASERSGGGAPDPGTFDQRDSARLSRSSSDSLPTLSAQVTAQTAAQSAPESRETGEAETQPNARALVHAREGADSPNSYDRATAEQTGPMSDAGVVSDDATQLADNRQRAASEVPLAMGDAEDDDEERKRNGSRNTQLAQGPNLSRQVEMGIGQNTEGQPDSKLGQLSESLAADMIERAAGSVGGTIARGAANGLLQSAAALPVTDFSGSGKSDQRQRTSRETSASGLASAATGKGRRGNASSELPQLSRTGTANNRQLASSSRSNQGPGTGSGLKASSMATERSNNNAGARLEIVAVEGPAGLADSPAPSVGVPNRPASRDSDQLMPDFQQRFRSKQAGGTPAYNPDAFTAKQAFRGRQAGTNRSAAPSTEASIELGLEFLARNQKEDGSWALEGFDRGHRIHDDYQLISDSAATGLAVLAFQGAGYTHKEFKYAPLLDKALKSLISRQLPSGCLYVDSETKSDDFCRMYSHAIATLALCEAYGMTRDPDLKEPAEKALEWITNTQDPDKGGWRYYAELKRRRSDTSVTGWMLMALQSARLAELKIETETLEGIEKWLELAVDNQPHLYRYNPYSIDTETDNRSGNRTPTPSMTAVGLLMKIYTGLGKNNPTLDAGAQYLLDQQLPSDSNSMARDTYYWYYATQVIKHVDGEPWEKWNNQLHPLLGRTQIKTGEMAGSWHPYDPVPDRWGQHAGRLYVTTMNLLSLEVRYRLLPLYEETLE